MNSFKNWRLRTKTVVPALMIMILVSAFLGFYISENQKEQAVQQARQAAKAIQEQISADRKIYTEKVVQKLRKEGVVEVKAVETKYLTDHGTIPLPASFVHLTSDVVNSKGFHSADLLSLWNINPTKKPRTAFERESLEKLARNPAEEDKTWSVEGTGDNAQLVAISADVASNQLCVDCHNNHPDSAKKDFRLNDVMGGLVIKVPLKTPFDNARKTAMTLTGALIAAFAFVLAIIGYIQWVFISKPLLRLEKSADMISMGELEQPVVADSEDEVGSLAKAFERMRVSLAQAMKSLDKD